MFVLLRRPRVFGSIEATTFLTYGGAEHTLREVEDRLAEHFMLTPAERAELLPSGQQGVFR